MLHSASPVRTEEKGELAWFFSRGRETLGLALQAEELDICR